MLHSLLIVFAVAATAICCANAIDLSSSVDLDLADDFIGGSGRMVGGRNASARNAPFVVSLQTGLYGHFCGGTIITQRWILSAAHCTKNRAVGSIVARAGGLNHNSGGQLYEIRAVRLHPNYNTVTHLNDVSTLQTVKPIEFGERVKPLPYSQAAVQLNTQVTIFGWGRKDMRATSPLPVRLQFVRGRTITQTDCRMRLQAANLPANVHFSTMCTAPQQGVGVCSGVGGGPVVVDDRLVGVVSYVARCAAGVPDVLTAVQSYAQWIYENSR